MSLTYNDTLQRLYASTTVFETEGAPAYKPGLDASRDLDQRLGHPHRSYQTIHVAGTNGKGSVCHTLAAIFQQSGYRTGLYTSPHLVDFCERIRVDGQTIREEFVVDFAEKYHPADKTPRSVSFFEITTAMALAYFREMKVDIAIIETGLGGRLDCTNIISPILSIITNISTDHTDLLGDSLEKIAAEKAGIIKPNTPVVIGNAETEPVKQVFVEKARLEDAPIFFAEKMPLTNRVSRKRVPESHLPVSFIYSKDYGKIIPTLNGLHQARNARTVLAALRVMEDMNILREKKLCINPKAVPEAFAGVTKITGLRGRWEEIRYMNRDIIVDIAHNAGAWQYIGRMACEMIVPCFLDFAIVLGLCRDKDVDDIIQHLPKNLKYYFTSAKTPRAMPARELACKAQAAGIEGKAFATVDEALLSAIKDACVDGGILVSGSAYVAGEALSLLDRLRNNT
ncbi:MAG: bifunctional folylpolyglutamate synthase/dihydrofolate synthase [Tannerellaceae bacterium]|jgi:dihydrofolate synthase/folylpolyglutamate synthase|nr:bifunctional folylpolyglutamate synthase/dihydrofolate synthase [Tannerellaceae bacterium]